MTIGPSAEVPFTAGMEREPEKFCETTVHVGKKLLRLDGMIERLLEKARMAMGRPDRGPDPDYSSDDERVMIPVRMFEQIMRRPGHGPGGVSGSSKILTILVALNTALLIGIGGWLLVTVAQHDKDIAVIKCQIDPQCREALARVRP